MNNSDQEEFELHEKKYRVFEELVSQFINPAALCSLIESTNFEEFFKDEPRTEYFNTFMKQVNGCKECMALTDFNLKECDDLTKNPNDTSFEDTRDALNIIKKHMAILAVVSYINFCDKPNTYVQ